MNTEERQMQMAVKYDLPLEFCEKLFDKIVDKSYYERAVKMFVDGRLKYSDAVSDDSLDIEAIRHDVAKNLLELRKTRREVLELRKRVAKYYTDECYHLVLVERGNRFAAFVDADSLTLSAIATMNDKSKDTKFIYANNTFEKYGAEQLHNCLLHLRSLNKTFVRRLKHLCKGEPADTFKFDERTIRNKR